MKLCPDKLQLGRKVTYCGVESEACKQVGDKRTTIYISPSEEKLQAFPDMKTPQLKTEVQCISGMGAQIKRVTV